MSVGNSIRRIDCDPLFSPGRRLRELPFKLKQILKVVITPESRCRGPSNLQATRDSILTVATAEVAGPAQALLFQRGAFRLWALMRLWRSTMTFTKGMTAGDQRHDFFIVHGHALKGRTDILGCGHIVTTGIRAFRVHIDQTHMGGGQVIV